MRRVISSGMFILLLMAACTSTGNKMTPVNYVQHLENPENDYNRTIVVGSLEYNIQLATSSYMAIKDVSGKSGDVDVAALKGRLKELEGYIFFIIRMKQKQKPGVSEELVTKADAERMVMYYNSAAEQDISMQADGVNYQPVSYLFENNYSLVPYNSILAGFQLPDSVKNIELIFNDKYHGNSYIKTKFSQEETSNLPGLIIK